MLPYQADILHNTVYMAQYHHRHHTIYAIVCLRILALLPHTLSHTNTKLGTPHYVPVCKNVFSFSTLLFLRWNTFSTTTTAKRNRKKSIIFPAKHTLTFRRWLSLSLQFYVIVSGSRNKRTAAAAVERYCVGFCVHVYTTMSFIRGIYMCAHVDVFVVASVLLPMRTDIFGKLLTVLLKR